MLKSFLTEGLTSQRVAHCTLFSSISEADARVYFSCGRTCSRVGDERLTWGQKFQQQQQHWPWVRHGKVRCDELMTDVFLFAWFLISDTSHQLHCFMVPGNQILRFRVDRRTRQCVYRQKSREQIWNLHKALVSGLHLVWLGICCVSSKMCIRVCYETICCIILGETNLVIPLSTVHKSCIWKESSWISLFSMCESTSMHAWGFTVVLVHYTAWCWISLSS